MPPHPFHLPLPFGERVGVRGFPLPFGERVGVRGFPLPFGERVGIRRIQVFLSSKALYFPLPFGERVRVRGYPLILAFSPGRGKGSVQSLQERVVVRDAVFPKKLCVPPLFLVPLSFVRFSPPPSFQFPLPFGEPLIPIPSPPRGAPYSNSLSRGGEGQGEGKNFDKVCEGTL